MTAARAKAGTAAIKPAARAIAKPPIASQAMAPEPKSAERLSPRRRCACGGGCPRCGNAGNARTEQPASARHEYEAKTIGARVMRSSPRPEASTAAGPRVPGGGTGARERTRARSASAPATGPPAPRRRPVPATARPPALGIGRPLNIAERERFEWPLGRDLLGVRIYDDPPAEAAAAERHAHAFTYGSHIVLGRQVQRAPEHLRLAVLAHELVHVSQQTGPPPANDNNLDHQARAPPAPWSAPALSPAPLGVMCLSEDDDSIIPRWASDAAGAVASAGEGAFDTVAEGVSDAADFVAESAGAVVDRLAPGLLAFLRGGALGQMTDLFCRGIDSLLSTLFASLGEIDFMSAIESTFRSLAQGVRGVQAAIGETADDALGTVLGPLVEALKAWGGPLVEAIQSAATSVNDLFSSVWDGLAVPALDILERIGGAVWQGFNDLVTWVWDLTEPIRTGVETAWNWLLETFDLAWNSTSGVRDWLAETASTAWTAFLETIEPIRGPLEVVGGIALLLSPVGPIIVLTQVVPPLWEKITWLWDNWNTEDILVQAREVLQNDILPAILGTVSGTAAAIGAAAAWLADLVGQFGSAMSGVLGAFGANQCLAAVTNYLNNVAGQFERLSAWAESGFAGLSEALQAVFDALVAIFQPILDFLVRLTMVAINPPMLPFAIAGAIWLLCPDKLKPPVINFVLDLLIAFVDGSTVLLIGLGPMALVLKAGVLGFLRELRGGEKIDDQRRIDASNKIASLAAGGGPAFVLGFSLGFLHGVIDGVIDPFRLIFLIGKVLVAGAQVVGRALAPYVLSTVPGAAGAVAGFREAVAEPPATAPPTTAPPAAAPTPAPQPATPAGGEAAGPAPEAPGPEAQAPAAAPASAAPAEATASAEELPPLVAEPGDLTDAEVVAALGPAATSEFATSEAETPIDDTALADEMRSEMETEGATVGGLAQLLGDAWDWIMQGADSLGRSAANAFIDFILLPDFQLGRKLGFVSGYIALQALIIYLTAGGYAAIEATAPLWRQLLALFLRFLDLGGEILGLLGKALRPLKGPFLAGIGAARGFLSKFRFARGLIERIEQLAAKLFRFGDEAAAAGSRGGREAAEEAGERAAREAAEEGGERATREAAEETGERAAREAAEEGGERAGREGAEEAGEATTKRAAPGETAEDATVLARKKAVELPMAIAAARTITTANDVVNTPTPVLIAQLFGLRSRYRWIEGFRATPLASPGVFTIDLLASIHNIVPKYTTLPTTPAEIHARVDALRNSGRITAQARPPRTGKQIVTEQLQDIENRALAGEVGAQGEIAALERKVIDQNQRVELIPATRDARFEGRGRPDVRAPDTGQPRQLADVKTTVTPRSAKGWEKWIKHEINDVNAQVGTSGLRVGQPGAAELQVFDAASASLKAQSPDDVLRWVRGNFNENRGRSLARVSIFADGSLLYEFTRAADGTVSRTFP